MLNLDPAKLLVIGMLALVLLGPERLPRVARQLGGAWRELTRLRDQVTGEVKAAFPIEDLPRIPNAASAISNAVSTVTSPLGASLRARDAASSSTGGTEGADDVLADSSDEQTAAERPLEGGGRPRDAIRGAPAIVVHGALGEFAFVPDDPSMN